MIRLIQRRLIIPRGDTGSFSLPVLANKNTGDIAVFTIFDSITKTRMYQKIVEIEGDILNITFSHNDTVNLKPGKYFWDIKFYTNPQFVEDELVNGDEVDSYYAGFTIPECEIRETGDNYLISPDSPTATLSPDQLDIITAAIASLNEAIEKTNTNVEHYPIIRNNFWYTWNAEQNDYVNSNVCANGIAGNGISSVVLNNDYTLTLNFTDGTSFTSSSIRGEVGNGINDIILNNDYTLTITYTDGSSYTTSSIRGPIGLTPELNIGVVQEGPVAAATITGTAANPILNLTLPNADVPTRTSQLINDSDFTTNAKVDNLILIQNEQPVNENNKVWIKETFDSVQIPTMDNLPTKVSELENDSHYAVDANYVHTDNNYTTAEKNKLSGIAAGAEVNVNADWNANSGDAAILNKPTNVSAFINDSGYITVESDPTVPAWAKAPNKPTYTANEVGAANENIIIIQNDDPQNNNNKIWIERDTTSVRIPTMEDIPSKLSDLINDTGFITTAVIPTRISQLTDDSGHYIKPTAGIPASDLANGVIPDISGKADKVLNATSGNFVSLDVNGNLVDSGHKHSDYLTEHQSIPVQDVQINGTSIISQGIANIINSSSSDIKIGTELSKPIVPNNQHEAVFYGLAKAAGDTTQSQSANPVNTYTDEAKVAIQKMLGIYEAPWELIREDTFVNETEADYIITVDSNGQSFELTDVIMMFETPKQETAATKDQYGQIWFYYNPNTYYASEPGAWTQDPNATAKGYVTIIEQKSGIMEIRFSNVATSSNRGAINYRYGTGFTGTTQGVQYVGNSLSFIKVTIPKITGTGHYKLYGKRKWQ